jgi:hypothetical protein
MVETKKASNTTSSDQNAIPDEEVRQESSKAANQALEAQKKAKKLKNAAAGAGDPDERQKLMEQAIDAQIEAESFGKTAKYMRSGAFQGLAVGAGMGVAPGASLGALTGTLVGGVATTLTVGLGGGIGAAAGALHGPFWNLGEVAGKGIKKATGINSWGWDATSEQKKVLEKMIGQIKEEDMPEEEELGSWAESAKGTAPSMPSLPSIGRTRKSNQEQGNGTDAAKRKREASETHPGKRYPQRTRDSQQQQQPQSQAPQRAPGKKTGNSQKKPRKLERRSGRDKKPRKLEVRSDKNNTQAAKSAGV